MIECRPGLVSTIIPVRNRPVLLVAAVESVLAQTYRPIEAIIVDDGSSDDTTAVGQALAAAHPDEVRFARTAAIGVASARNTGLEAASGEFIQFLDSDDLLMPDKFARQVGGLRDHPDCGISYCLTREYPLGGEWSGLPARGTGESRARLFPHLLMGRVWAAPSPLYRRDVVEANGPFRELAIYEDWEFEGRAASRNVRLHHCRAYLADKRDIHHLTGERKGGVPPHTLTDYAWIHERMHGYALAAGVAAADLDRYAAKLARAATSCAAAGLEAEAGRLIDLALRSAVSPWRRARLQCYAGLANRVGWARAGRWASRAASSPVAAVWRRTRERPAAFRQRWQHRLSAAWATVSGRPLSTWPHLLASGWANRQSRPRLR
ncbi:MAG: glycosyltransferase family 2 protein [Vicinamibacterales bacterium]|jgi:glycosyltransferase involved in cell wall biosynthesis